MVPRESNTYESDKPYKAEAVDRHESLSLSLGILLLSVVHAAFEKSHISRKVATTPAEAEPVQRLGVGSN